MQKTRSKALSKEDKESIEEYESKKVRAEKIDILNRLEKDSSNHQAKRLHRPFSRNGSAWFIFVDTEISCCWNIAEIEANCDAEAL